MCFDLIDLVNLITIDNIAGYLPHHQRDENPFDDRGTIRADRKTSNSD